MSVANQFRGLAMENLIGAPLKAACEANILMAKATSDFINDVGFIKVPKNPEDPNSEIINGAPRMVDFSFEKPGLDDDGHRVLDLVKIRVPILAIVPIPNLQVSTIDVSFQMEVKNSTSESDKSHKEGSFSAEGSGGMGPFKVSVKVSGSISSSKERTRSSDSSAKYEIRVNATNYGMPEGLARILDMMNQSAAPESIERFTADPNTGKISRDEKTGLPSGNSTLVNNDGQPVPTATSGTQSYNQP